MNKLQQNLYDLLIELDNICSKYDIQYYLAYGTTLGAIRHKRFLPWDDDIDLFITRDNFNRLTKIIENDESVLPDGRSLIYNENTTYYSNLLARYVNNDTTAIYISQSFTAKACGQHIEFFILDPMPNDEEKRNEYNELFRVYAELTSPYFVVCKNLSLSQWQRHYELYKKYCDRIDEEGEEKILNELKEYLQQYSEEECEQYHVRWGINDHIFDKSYFGNGRMETFEGNQFPIPENSEAIFRFFYGDDWMYVPEIGEQKTHNALQNIDVPFKEYADCYLDKINREKVFDKYKVNKRNNADLFYNRRRIEQIAAEVKVNVESKYVLKDLDGKEKYLQQLLNDSKYDEILDEFGEYMSLQMLGDVKKNNIYVPISDRNLLTLLSCLTEQGKYFEAAKFLKIRKAQKKKLDKELLEIEKKIDMCRQLSIARYDRRDPQSVQSIIDEYDDVYPNLLDICRAKLWICQLNATSDDDYRDIDKLCDEILISYPFDGETMAYQARAKSELGFEKEAGGLYEKSINNTKNGFIWQKVEDEFGISRIEIERENIGC